MLVHFRPYQIDYMFHGEADYKCWPGWQGKKNKNKKMNLIKNFMNIIKKKPQTAKSIPPMSISPQFEIWRYLDHIWPGCIAQPRGHDADGDR